MSQKLGRDNSEQRPLLTRAPLSAYAATTSASGAETPPTKPPLNDLSRAQLILILAALWSAIFLGALDTTIVATLLASIGSHFDRANQASYLGSAYLLSVCCFTPLYGRLSDIIGRKGAMLLGLSLFGGGTLLCGLAPSMGTLIAARAIAGMGGGGYVITYFNRLCEGPLTVQFPHYHSIMTVSSVTVTDLIPLKQRGLYQGMANILFGLGSGLGGPLGGFINDRFGWRWAFLIQLPIIATSFLLSVFFLNVKLPAQPLTIREKFARIDYLGSLTLVLGVGCGLLAVTLKGSEELSWSHSLIWGLLLCGVVFCFVFVGVEGFVSKQPIMPLRLLKQRTPFAVAMANFFTCMVSFSALYNIPLYYQSVLLESASNAGLHLLPISVALAAGSLGAGIYMKATGRFYYFTLMCALLVIISNGLMACWNDSTSTLHSWGGLFLPSA
ncbi:hypothetical protein FRB95_002199 [Tulasnella sp. JGI-2019a]|nr:hypothetical protein FRB95_002199 [Tulasnella sp. JGI-2019a]